MAAILNGVTLLITLEAPTAGVLSQTTEQIYDDAKQWQLNANNRKFPFPFTTSGGEGITATTIAGQFYFLRNDLGWRIRTTDEDQDVFLDGNLIPTDITLPMVIGRATRTVAYFGLQPLVTGVTGIETLRKLQQNRMETNPVTGVMTVFDDDDVTVLLSGNIYEDVLAAQLYRGRGIERRNRLT